MVKPPTSKPPPDLYRILAASFTILVYASSTDFEDTVVVKYLVERGKDIVRKLNFGDSSMSHHSHPNAKASDALFSKGSIEDTLAAWFH